MKYTLLIASLWLSHNLIGQSIISGKTSHLEEPIPFATINVFENDRLIKSEQSDINGNYSLVLNPGTYNIQVECVGFQNETISSFLIDEKDQSLILNVACIENNKNAELLTNPITNFTEEKSVSRPSSKYPINLSEYPEIHQQDLLGGSPASESLQIEQDILLTEGQVEHFQLDYSSPEHYEKDDFKQDANSRFQVAPTKEKELGDYKWHHQEWESIIDNQRKFNLLNSTLNKINYDSSIYKFIVEMEIEFNSIQERHVNKLIELNEQLGIVSKSISNYKATETENLSSLISEILLRDQLRNEIASSELSYSVEMSQIRYRKGIDLIKMIYEKTLGLDHHFSALHTHQNVAMLSNPNAFPGFQKAKEIISNRVSKKNKVKLPKLFDSNPFVSMTYAIVASLLGNGNSAEKDKELNNIACILDFTVRMNTDLKIIYYETEFLKNNNEALKEECENLFSEYSKVVGYRSTLSECRKTDDWEVLNKFIDEFVESLEEEYDAPEKAYLAQKKRIDLEFSIDRLLQFLNTYNAFVSQGEKYYQKFEMILNNYSNEAYCEGALPHQFNDLKSDISLSILKFNAAYNMSELKGSRLKDLMYGYADIK